jgi:hypothetical protein
MKTVLAFICMITPAFAAETVPTDITPLSWNTAIEIFSITSGQYTAIRVVDPNITVCIFRAADECIFEYNGETHDFKIRRPIHINITPSP